MQEFSSLLEGTVDKGEVTETYECDVELNHTSIRFLSGFYVVYFVPLP